MSRQADSTRPPIKRVVLRSQGLLILPEAFHLPVTPEPPQIDEEAPWKGKNRNAGPPLTAEPKEEPKP